jgi:hypothetical protein
MTAGWIEMEPAVSYRFVREKRKAFMNTTGDKPWEVSDFHWLTETEASWGKTTTLIDCWNYENEEGVETVKLIKDIPQVDAEARITSWLKDTAPKIKDGQEPSSGLRIIHRGQWNSAKSPFSPELTKCINEAVQLPDVSDYPSGLSGGEGKFIVKNSIPGQYPMFC